MRYESEAASIVAVRPRCSIREVACAGGRAAEAARDMATQRISTLAAHPHVRMQAAATHLMFRITRRADDVDDSRRATSSCWIRCCSVAGSVCSSTLSCAAAR